MAENLRDRKCYSRNYPKRLSAEQILDAVDQLTQTATTFEAMPDRTKAIRCPTRRFVPTFSRCLEGPMLRLLGECERANESTLAQSLHFANSKELIAKLSDASGIAASFANRSSSHLENVTVLYIRAFSRKPTDSETAPAIAYLEGKSNKLEAYQDLTWAILNCKEFLFLIID